MSQNPYQRPLGTPPYGQPYSASQYSNAGPPKQFPWRIIAIVGGIVSVLGLCCCGGIFSLFMVGKSAVENELKAQVASSPAVLENIGEITKFKMNFVASGSIEDDETFVYDVEGTKGKGQITIYSVTNDEGKEEIVWATLTNSTGESFNIIGDRAQ